MAWSMTMSISVTLEPTESKSVESKQWTVVILLTLLPPSFPGGICVDRGLWGPLSAGLQGLWGDRCHLVWTDLSPGQAAGQRGESAMTKPLLNPFIDTEREMFKLKTWNDVMSKTSMCRVAEMPTEVSMLTSLPWSIQSCNNALCHKRWLADSPLSFSWEMSASGEFAT